jgi:hypothetical protein
MQGTIPDFWNVQPEATERLLTSFFDTGVADDSLYVYAPMSYKARLSFPMLAKVALGVLVLVLLAGVAVIWFAILRVRRRSVRGHR